MILLELLFPKHCFACKKLGKYICDRCKGMLYVVKHDICIYCNKSSYLGLTHPGCERRNGVDGSIFLYKYNNYLKIIIKTLKYRLVRDGFEELMIITRDPLRTKLGGLISNLNISPILSPIPLSKIRKNQRGFNQSKIITQYISKYLGLEDREYLIRSKNTIAQANLKSRILRYRNLNGAFRIKKGVKIKDEIVILVDDVLTSGSTAKAAARTLKRNKASKVFIFALAKG